MEKIVLNDVFCRFNMFYLLTEEQNLRKQGRHIEKKYRWELGNGDDIAVHCLSDYELKEIIELIKHASKVLRIQPDSLTAIQLQRFKNGLYK